MKRSLPSFEEGIEKKEDSEDDDDEWLFNVGSSGFAITQKSRYTLENAALCFANEALRCAKRE